jgi:CxxC-x17-CxxC domain-containing protein
VPITMGGNMVGYQGGGGGGFGGSREMHKAVCSECKKECEVPFKPRDDRPIYCKDCYSKRKNEGR